MSSSAGNQLLAKDKRLATSVSAPPEIQMGREKRTRVGRVLSLINKRTQVSLTADYENITNQSIFIAFDKVKASDLMDGVAALWLTPWKQDSANSYKLVGRGSELDDVLLPTDDNVRAKYAAGTEFIDALEAMPRTGVARDLLMGRTISVSDLPFGVQQTLAQIVGASEKIMAAKGRKARSKTDFLPQATLKAQISHPKEGVSVWFLKIEVPDRVDIGTLITNYEQQMKKYPPSVDPALYTPVKFAISQDQARRLPQLQRKVQVRLPNATAGEVLQALHKQCGVAIIADAPELMKDRANVSINVDSLAAAFDALTATFPKTQWEYRPSNFWIFRGPMNTAVRASN